MLSGLVALGGGRRARPRARGSPTCCAAGLARENYAGRRVAFPAGAALVACSLIALAPLAVLDDRADLDLLDPELRRWIVYVLGVALLGLLDDALGRGAAADTPRGWRGHARAVLAGRFSTGAIKAVGALALAAYAVSGLGREGIDYVADLALLLLTTNLFNLLDLRPGAGREGVRAAARRTLPRRLDGRAARAARGLHRPGAGGGRLHAARAGDARRHRLEPGRRARRGRDAGHPRRHRALDRARGRRGADDLRGVSVDLEDDRLDSATALARLARQSEIEADAKR